MKPLVVFKDVSLGYGRRVVLKSINFSIKPGDFLGIVGPNGAGKTTLLKSILGIAKPLSGRIEVNDKGRARFGYVPQRQVTDNIYPLTVLEVVLMGRYGLLGPLRSPTRHDVDRCMECLGHLGITELAGKPYRDLSGGQKQRTLIARALASEPTILILDEPTTDMDVAGERAIMDFIRHLHDEHSLTIVMVSHTLHTVINYVKDVAFAGDGRVEIAPVEQAITSENLSRLYSAPVSVGEIAGVKVVV